MTPLFVAQIPANIEQYGIVMFLVVAVMALVLGRYVVPRWVFEASEERNKLLEKENSDLNEAVKEQTRTNGSLREELAALRAEVAHLRAEVAALRSGG